MKNEILEIKVIGNKNVITSPIVFGLKVKGDSNKFENVKCKEYSITGVGNEVKRVQDDANEINDQNQDELAGDSVAESVIIENEWTCDICTFINEFNEDHIDSAKCKMCTHVNLNIMN